MKFKTLTFVSLILSISTITKVVAATDQTVCTRTPSGSVNIRSGPGTNYRIVDEAYNGQTMLYSYEGMHTDDNAMPPRDRYGYYWLKVSDVRSGSTGYMRADFLGCSPSNLQQWFVNELRKK